MAGIGALSLVDCVGSHGRMTARLTDPDDLEARTTVPTPAGPMSLVARSRRSRWWVSVACAGSSGTGIGPSLGLALHAAFELYAAGRDSAPTGNPAQPHEEEPHAH